MQAKHHIIALAAAMLLPVGFIACSDDDFTESIFDTTEYYLDKSSYTFPLDTFIKVNFLEPYNLRYIYKMEDIGSDMQKNLVPATYEKSTELAVLAKYLWYDVYKKCVSDDFLKTYSPRIIHVIGSPAYNPSSGTETLGYAEGGLKVTLYNANNLDVENIDQMNEKFFKTMHHEFSHILAQNYTYPTSFQILSNGLYDAINWSTASDSVCAAHGFVSTYASSGASEDWVEVIANYIVKDYKTWEGLLNTASYDWEEAVVDASEFDALVTKVNQGLANRDSIGYYMSVESYSSGKASQYNIERKLIQRDADDNPILSSDGEIVYLETDGIDGRAIIEQKLDMCKTYLADYFNADLDEIRDEVQRRQWVTDDNGDFVFDADGNYINALVSPSDDNPSETLMETLLDQVNQYKALQP
ncbi:MAG: putative zinc-binding metallopeptidase [Prevotella sp.]|nr:putative zinc-binding metallopeptidase [Prevotella sp.]